MLDHPSSIHLPLFSVRSSLAARLTCSFLPCVLLVCFPKSTRARACRFLFDCDFDCDCPGPGSVSWRPRPGRPPGPSSRAGSPLPPVPWGSSVGAGRLRNVVSVPCGGLSALGWQSEMCMPPWVKGRRGGVPLTLGARGCRRVILLRPLGCPRRGCYGAPLGLPPSRCAGGDSVGIGHPPLDTRVVPSSRRIRCRYRRPLQSVFRGPVPSGPCTNSGCGPLASLPCDVGVW